MMRPAATALTTRVARMMPSCSSTFTSAKIAECVFNKLFVLDAIDATMPHGVRKRYRAAFVLLGGNHAVRQNDIIGLQAGEPRARHLLCETQKLRANVIGRGCDGVGH